MNIDCNMHEDVTGIGYQFYSRTAMLGTRVTTGITSPATGIYTATATPPNGTVGIKWNDAGGTRVAYAAISPVLDEDSTTPYETARKLIENHFNDLWNHTTFCPVTFEGLTITERESGWGRLSIAHGDGTEPTTGQRFTRTTGIVFLSIFVSRENGTKLFNRCADRAGQIFNRTSLRQDNVTIKFGICSMSEAGTRDGYRQKNIACSFTRDVYPSA